MVPQNILAVLHHNNIKDKRLLNLRMLTEIKFGLKDISKKIGYLPNSWCDLKLLTHTLYTVYRLYCKILLVHGNRGMAQKCQYHNLICGPQSVSKNIETFSYLCKFIDLQNELLKAFVSLCKDTKVMDQIALLFHWVIQILDKMIYLEAKNSSVFKDGVPMKYEFMEC